MSVSLMLQLGFVNLIHLSACDESLAYLYVCLVFLVHVNFTCSTHKVPFE